MSCLCWLCGCLTVINKRDVCPDASLNEYLMLSRRFELVVLVTLLRYLLGDDVVNRLTIYHA